MRRSYQSTYERDTNRPWEQPQRVARDYCYDDEWLPENYRHKTTIDLIQWMKNLRKKVADLLEEEPFNAELFEKLENRHNAIKKEVESRRLQEAKPDLSQSRKRAAEWLQNELTSETSSSVTSPSPIRAVIPRMNADIDKARAERKALEAKSLQDKQDAVAQLNWSFNDQ